MRVMVKKSEHLTKDGPEPFNNDEKILEVASLLFELRAAMSEYLEDEQLERISRVEQRIAAHLHQSLRLSSDKPRIAGMVRKYNLNRIELEILLLLALNGLGMYDGRDISDIEDIQNAMNCESKRRLAVMRVLSSDGRLARNKLVFLESNHPPKRTGVEVTPYILLPFTCREGKQDAAWPIKSYEQLLDRTYEVIRCLHNRAEHLEYHTRSGNYSKEILQDTKEIRASLRKLRNSLKKHKDWPLQRIFADDLSYEERYILLALLGKALGFYDEDDQLFSGKCLARCASKEVTDVRANMRLLMHMSSLRKQGYIEVCGVPGMDTINEDDSSIGDYEFELTSSFLNKLKIKRRDKSRNKSRNPIVRMEHLVLSSRVIKALEMAKVQIRYGNVLTEDWGLREVIPYGRAVTVLFSGPPGTGKTASAEALAHELDKKIIVVNYAQIQNLFVGQTEKNIVRVFKQAREDNAVLFWDECDAMFYDRDSAAQNWEVRDVNVLLQELERFEGLCILSTNRKITLDKALERRIADGLEALFEKLRLALTDKVTVDPVFFREQFSFHGQPTREISKTTMTASSVRNPT